MKKSRWFLALILFGAGVILMILLLISYAYITGNRTVPTYPHVNINSTFPDQAGVINQPVVVFGEASDPDGIESVELWVNGELIASQSNPEPGDLPFAISQTWIPDGPGNYLMVFRGMDRMGYMGSSSPALIQISARSFQQDPALLGQYIVMAGDTLESIAAFFGTTPDEIRRLNPGLEDLTPEISISVPPRSETETGDLTPVATLPPSGGVESPTPAAGGSDDAPHVSPAPPSSSVAGTPALSASAPWWSALHLPASFDCILFPGMCSDPASEAEPLPPASDVHASQMESCQASISWTDNTANEAGYRIYRLVMRPRFRSDLLELLSPVAASGARSTYIDTNTPAGQFFYAVVLVNDRGEEIWGAPSEQITSTCPSSTASGSRNLDIEALQMTVNDPSLDRLYCYLSLAGSPFERIPDGASEFITNLSGTWNIADFASGENRRRLWMASTDPLEITAECLGRQGGTLINLGRFTRSHPPEQWDGRMLTSGPDDGSFSVTYHILPATDTSSSIGGEDLHPLTDPLIPPPYNLHLTPDSYDCTLAPGGSIAVCSHLDSPGLAWDYEVLPGSRPVLYYKIHNRLEWETRPVDQYRTVLYEKYAPIHNLQLHYYYSVSAVVGFDPVTHDEIESPLSEEVDVPRINRTLRITLVDMWTYGFEGDAYGWLSFNGQRAVWNEHWDTGAFGGGRLSMAPFTTTLAQATVYRWEDLFLNQGSGYDRYNNTVLLQISAGEPVRMGLQLWEHHSFSDDQTWCYLPRSGRVLLEGRSIEAWAGFDQEVIIGDSSTRDYLGCEIVLQIQAMP